MKKASANCVVPENIHDTPPMEGFWFESPNPYFPLTIVAFETLHPLGISIDPPWGGHQIFSGTAHYAIPLLLLEGGGGGGGTPKSIIC